MSKKDDEDLDMPAEIDFSGGVRGKYVGRIPTDVAMVMLEPDVAAAFPDAASVNEALRALARIAARQKPSGGKPRRKG